jgi:uncharacterized Zn finger protein (UPF0148 family)
MRDFYKRKYELPCPNCKEILQTRKKGKIICPACGRCIKVKTPIFGVRS